MTHLTRRCLLKGAAIAAAGAAAPLAAWAEGAYPDHPLKLVVPFPAGALTDTLGRMVANNLSPVLGQPIVVENRQGAGTLLGAAQGGSVEVPVDPEGVRVAGREGDRVVAVAPGELAQVLGQEIQLAL